MGRFTIFLNFGSRKMTVTVNDIPYEMAEGTTLDEFIESLNIQIQGIAVAIDYEVIPKSAWKETILTEGIALMMIHAISGG